MASVINDDCICCGICESECPVGAISMGDKHMVIDASTCIDCWNCSEVCPAMAIDSIG